MKRRDAIRGFGRPVRNRFEEFGHDELVHNVVIDEWWDEIGPRLEYTSQEVWVGGIPFVTVHKSMK